VGKKPVALGAPRDGEENGAEGGARFFCRRRGQGGAQGGAAPSVSGARRGGAAM
jgi:hypothetical protein